MLGLTETIWTKEYKTWRVVRGRTASSGDFTGDVDVYGAELGKRATIRVQGMEDSARGRVRKGPSLHTVLAVILQRKNSLTRRVENLRR